MPNCPARINELADLNSQVMAEITTAHRLQSLIQSLSTLRLKTCDVTVHVSSGFINRKTMILYSEAHFLTKHSLSSYKYAWKQITGHKLGNETRSSGVRGLISEQRFTDERQKPLSSTGPGVTISAAYYMQAILTQVYECILPCMYNDVCNAEGSLLL